MLGSAESQVPKLIIREIIFEEFQRVCDHNPPTLQTDGQTDRQTDRQTDGRTDNLSWQYRAPLRFAR